MSDDQNTTQDPISGGQTGQSMDPNGGINPPTPPTPPTPPPAQTPITPTPPAGQTPVPPIQTPAYNPISPAQSASYNSVPPAATGYTNPTPAASAAPIAGTQGAYNQPVAGQPMPGAVTGATAGTQMGGAQPGGVMPPAGGGLTDVMNKNVNVQDLVTNSATYQQQAQQLLLGKPIPPHPNTTFNEQEFVQLLAGSISLTLDEKQKIFQSIPKLSQYQIDELIKIFREEGQKFQELEKKHADEIAKLETQHADSAEAVAQREEEERKRKEEEEQQVLLMQQLGQTTPVSDTFELVFYVNEEMCGKKQVAKTITSEEAIAEAKAHPNVMAKIEGREVVDAVYTPDEKVVITIK